VTLLRLMAHCGLGGHRWRYGGESSLIINGVDGMMSRVFRKSGEAVARRK
jgi:hypothetical protein